MKQLFSALFCALVLHGHAHAGGLEVAGRELRFDGKPVMLRGVSVGDPFLAREGRPLSDYSTIARDWKANVVRMSVHPSVWKTTAHEKVLSTLDANVQAALQAGMFVIIDWHTIGFPDGFYEKTPYKDDPPDLYDSSFLLAKDFWKAVAAKFGGDGRVLFELWNEPLYQEDDGNPEAGQRWHELKPRFQELVQIIREQGKNVVLATSNYWAYNLRGIRNDLLKGGNIAYAWHIYAGHDEDDASAWAASLDELQTVAPVLVTEWGFQAKTDEHFQGTAKSFGEKFVRDFLEAKHLHSTAWCWHPEWTPVMLRNDWKTPTAMGVFVQKYLRAHATARLW